MTEDRPDQGNDTDPEDELLPLKVEVTNPPDEKNPTSVDTLDLYDKSVTEAEIKEMQDAT